MVFLSTERYLDDDRSRINNHRTGPENPCKGTERLRANRLRVRTPAPKERPERETEIFPFIQAAAADRHVLVVDDVPLNVKVIQSMLRRLGVSDVITAGNGEEAIEVLRKNPEIDLVLTDMWMPIMGGEGLIREIRSREQWMDLPVYAVTADIEVQKTCRDLGFTGILLKPITLHLLRAVLD